MPGEIQLEGLTKAFGEHVAVAGIDVDMPPGEFFTLLGPSGCGKTTTLRMIAGFEQPTSGRIMLDGTDVARVPPHRRNVNTVFQSYALFPHLDVAKNVAFGLKYQKLDKSERAKRVGRGARARQPDRVRAPQGRPALRWPAAARRAGAGAGAAAARAAARRAARRARRQAAQDPPGRAQGPAVGARDHVRVRHPRSGGGAHHERPDRGDEQGPGRAGGVAAVDLRGADDGVRGRVPRRVEPARGGGRGPRRRVVRRADRRPRVPLRPGRARRPGRGQGDDPARADRDRAARPDGRRAASGHRRAIGLPRRLARGPRARAGRRADEGDGGERRGAAAGVARARCRGQPPPAARGAARPAAERGGDRGARWTRRRRCRSA